MMVLFLLSMTPTKYLANGNSPNQKTTIKINELELDVSDLKEWKIDTISEVNYSFFFKDSNETKWIITLLSEQVPDTINSSKQYFKYATRDSVAKYHSEWTHETFVDIFNETTILKTYVYQDSLNIESRSSDDYYFLKNKKGYCLTYTCASAHVGNKFEQKKPLFEALLKSSNFKNDIIDIEAK